MKKRRQNIRKQQQLENLNSTVVDETYTENDAKNDFEILKSTVITESNINFVKDLLIRTSDYRLNILYDESADLLEHFSFFFAFPDLVGFN